MAHSKFDRLFMPTLGGLIGLYLAIFAYYIFATRITVPFLDLLESIESYDQYWRAGDWWLYLWLPRNEHRPIWFELLALIDIAWCRGTALPLFLFNSACFLVTVGGLLWAIWVADLAIQLKETLAAAIILLLAASHLVIYCSVPIEGTYVHNTAFFVLALVLLDDVGAKGPRTTIRRGAAIAAAVLAAFGVSAGLLALPVLLWAAWAGGLGRAWLIAIGLTAVVLFAAYLPGIPTGQLAHLLDRAALPKLADFYVRFLGLPWSHAASLVWFGRLVGCIVLGASTVTLLRCRILRRPVGRLERMGLALLMFSLLTAAMAAVSRWSAAPEQPMPIRYVIFAALAEAGLLLANTPSLNRLWQKGYRRPLQWATLAVATVFLVQQVAAGQAAVAVTIQYKNGYREFVTGESTGAPTIPVLLVNPAAAPENQKVLRIIRTLGIYQN